MTVDEALSAERQEPMTGAEHARAEGHGEEYARDVPRTCNGIWQWNGRGRRYVVIGHLAECPWHTDKAGGVSGGV